MDALIAHRGLVLTGNIEDYPSGIIVPVDKPYRWTSADVIRKLKYASIRHFNKKNLKVGHAGTLDPLATGVLLVCLGKATRLAQELQGHDKEYLAGVSFGATTASYDREKEVDAFYPLDGVSKESLEAVLPSFVGEQEQVAPLFSAKSVDGVRAYEMARKEFKASQKSGEAFDHSAAELLSKQRINIGYLRLVDWSDGCPDRLLSPENAFGHSHADAWAPPASVPRVARFSGETTLTGQQESIAGRVNPRINVVEIDHLGLPSADILVGCSKGTYIRALARDLGESLGSGAFLNNLRRTRTGGFAVEDALSIDEAMALFNTEQK